jgi:hypothetical protein
MLIVLEGRYGVGGSRLTGLLLDCGASLRRLKLLPPRLELDTEPIYEAADLVTPARFAWQPAHSPDTPDVERRLADCWLPGDLGSIAQSALRHRSHCLAAQQVEDGPAAALRALLEVCGALLLWDDLGRPRLSIAGELAAPASPLYRALLPPLECSGVELTDPSGAALVNCLSAPARPEGTLIRHSRVIDAEGREGQASLYEARYAPHPLYRG